MTLIKCPRCGHTVLSVASQCPACFTALGITFLGPEHRGELAECRSCGHPVRSNTRVCPHCGTNHPGRRNRAARRAVGLLSALTLLLVLATGVWKRVWDGLPGIPAHPAAPPVEEPAAADRPGPAPLQQGSLVLAHPIEVPGPSLESRWTVVWTNVRERPSKEAPVVRVFRPGTEVRGTAGRYGWWSIQLAGDSIGYIAGALLRR